ncbi:type 1 fimbrial protein [Salmonella enterica]|nr:type 1 fimbrial protein [Salmonella enterica]ECX5291079.1 type 1 fimbrial protein [Salmonella enterica]EGC6171961.1 type 1 fimbrial protein [Salmonella enterica]EIF0471123.1 type 1 fimbrial protein [Salmonella enterica]
MRILSKVFCAVLIAVYSTGGSVEAGLRLHGQTTLYGEVVASACSIALNDRYQSVAMGELPLRDLKSGRGGAAHDVVIHLENCLTSGWGYMVQDTDPAIRVRFEGLHGSQPGLFRTLGTARGVALQLSDDRREPVMPGEYLPVVYQKAYNQQVLKYRVALVPDGERLAGGDYSATLRFSINYE